MKTVQYFYFFTIALSSLMMISGCQSASIEEPVPASESEDPSAATKIAIYNSKLKFARLGSQGNDYPEIINLIRAAEETAATGEEDQAIMLANLASTKIDLLLISASKTGLKTAPKIVETLLPRFPWPPPKPSSMVVLPTAFFTHESGNELLLSDIDEKILRALDSSGYVERSYHGISDGFVLVTRLEAFNSDGTPKLGDDRWSKDVKPLSNFTLAGYLKALFTSNPGFFRVIVFAVTPHSFSPDTKKGKVSRPEAIDWISKGANVLPIPIASQKYSSHYSCTALVYEFKKEAVDKTAKTEVPGSLPAKVHLQRSGIWQGLNQ